MRPYAYDFFDSVLCCGEILAKNIRRMEALPPLPAKQLFKTGLPHYEALLARAAESPALSGPPGARGPKLGAAEHVRTFGTDFIAAIARRFKVIVRPHPQMKISQPELYARILATPGVEVDTGRTPSQAMSRAHILLSDISGIAHEFAFIYERPVVVVDRHLEPGGLEGELLGGQSELKQRCAEFIVPIPPGEMPNIVDHISDTLANHVASRIADVRAALVYNFGTASDVAADQLAAIFEREPRAGCEARPSHRGFGGDRGERGVVISRIFDRIAAPAAHHHLCVSLRPAAGGNQYGPAPDQPQHSDQPVAGAALRADGSAIEENPGAAPGSGARCGADQEVISWPRTLLLHSLSPTASTGTAPFLDLLNFADLFLQILVFATVYRYLAALPALAGQSFGPIPNLGLPDGLLVGVNLLPFVMTA